MSFPVTSSRFEMRDRLGSGGMGVVYRAWDRKRASVVALKTLTRLDPDYIQRFKNEFRSLSDLTHPNLVCLYELFNEDTLWYFTMEYIPGADFLRAVCPQATFDTAESPTESSDPDATIGIDQLLDRQPPSGLSGNLFRGPCDYQLLRSLIVQIAQGLSVIHAHGKLHSDMKPSNVAVTPDGRAVILDFGLVSDLQRRPAGDTSAPIVGTPHYMAPEQIGGQSLTPATDWYGLGVMLYVALVGRPPHMGTVKQILIDKQRVQPPAPVLFHGDVPTDLNELCVALLSFDPSARPDGTEIAKLLGAPDPFESDTSLPIVTSFVGRQDHLFALVELARQAENGTTSIASLSGDSGVGKSTLVAEFLKQESRKTLVWRGRCYEQESVPYKALDVIVDALSQYLGTFNSRDLQRYLPDQFDSLARLFPLLRPFARGSSGAGVTDHLELRRVAIDAFKELIRRIATRRLLIIHLDDLQWGDRDSGQMLEELLRAPAVPRLMLILSWRPEGEQGSELLSVLAPYLSAPEKFSLTMRRLHLQPFQEDEARLLTERLIGTDHHAEAAAEIARGSGGNPFFILEMARSFLRGGGHQSSTTLDGLIWSRTRSLPPPARTLLEVIAVSGKPLASFDAVRAAGLDAEDPRVFSLLRNEHLIRNTGASAELMDTYHDRIREAIVAGLATEIKFGHHHQIASALIASASQDPEAIAFHLESSGENRRALDYYLQAAEQSAVVLAFDKGVRLLRRCIELQGAGASRNLQLKLADMLANAGNGLEAARLYESLLRDSTAAELPELERKAAYHYCAAGYLDEGREIARRTLARAGMNLPGSRIAAIALMSVNRIRFRRRGFSFIEKAKADIPPQLLDRIDTAFDVVESLGMVDMIPAIAVATRGLFYALKAGDPARIVRAFSICASQLAADGDLNQARLAHGMLEVCRQIAARFDEPLLWAYYHMGLGFAAINQGRYAAPFDHFQEAEAYFQRCPGKAWNVATCRSLYLDSARGRGLIKTMGEQGRRFLREAEDRGDMFMATNLGCSPVPSALLYQGQPQEAIATTRYWLSRWRPKGLHYQHSIAGLIFIWSELYQGNPAAYAEAKKAWTILRQSLLHRMNSFRHVYLDCLGNATLALCRHSYDNALMAEAAAIQKRLLREPYPAAHASAAGIAAGIAALKGDQETAILELRSALATFEPLQMTLHSHSLRLRLAQLVGGDEGARLTNLTQEWAHQEGVKNLNGLMRVYTGGFKE